MRIEIRPSQPADFIKLLGQLPRVRAHCLTAVADGKVFGIGGFQREDNGSVWAAVVMSPEARRYPVAIHRAGLRAMQFALELGYREVFAEADGALAGAERWLVSLGFQHVAANVYLWRAPPLNS